MFNDPTTQNTSTEDWGIPQIADDSVRGYFSYLTAKSVANSAAKTPSSTYLVLIGGVVLLVLLLKRR